MVFRPDLDLGFNSYKINLMKKILFKKGVIV